MWSLFPQEAEAHDHQPRSLWPLRRGRAGTVAKERFIRRSSKSRMTMKPEENAAGRPEDRQPPPMPSISLPKGGGAIRGIGEKFAANPVTGTGSMTVPIATSPGRSGFGPQLSLAYDSGAGNGPFGFGWSARLPAITRKTDKGLPQYRDARGVRRLHSVWRGRPGAGRSGAERDVGPRDAAGSDDRSQTPTPSALPPAHRRPVRPHRALDPPWRRRCPLALHLPRQHHHAVRQGRDSRIADPGRSSARLQLADLRDPRRQGQRHRLRIQARGRRRSRPGAGPRTQPRRKRRSPTGRNRYLKAHPLRQPRTLLDGAGQRPRSPERGAAAERGWMFEVVFDYGEHARRRAHSRTTRANGRTATTRSLPTALASRCAPTGSASGC